MIIMAFSSKAYKESAGYQETPAINRVFFGVLTVIYILFAVKMLYEVFSPSYMSNGSSPPLAGWVIFNGIPIFGLALMTLRGKISLRLHKLWTPIGIFLLVWGWFIVLGHTLPLASGVFDAVLNYSYEAFIFSTFFGLLLAFVDFSPLQKYAFYFAPWAFYGVAFLAFGVFSIAMNPGNISVLAHPSDPNFFAKWDEFNDILVFISGPFFIYYMIRWLRFEWPGWKRLGTIFGAFVILIISLAVIINIVSSTLPADSQLGKWIRGDQTSSYDEYNVNYNRQHTSSQSNSSQVPVYTCPDRIVNDGSNIGIYGNMKYKLNRSDEDWIKTNCQNLQWP
jgi:uncharacterized membrane protein YgdD (TMEM256/DUF423 family)